MLKQLLMAAFLCLLLSSFAYAQDEQNGAEASDGVGLEEAEKVDYANGNEFLFSLMGSYIIDGAFYSEATDSANKKVESTKPLAISGGVKGVIEYFPVSWMTICIVPEFQALFLNDAGEDDELAISTTKFYQINANGGFRFLYPSNVITPYLRASAGYTFINVNSEDTNIGKQFKNAHTWNVQPAVGLMLRSAHLGFNAEVSFQYTPFKTDGIEHNTKIFMVSFGIDGIVGL